MTRQPSSLLRLGAAICLIVAATGPHPAAAASIDENRQAIQIAYETMNADFARHDLSGVMAFFTPDYQEDDTSGRCVNRDQTEQMYRGQLSQIRSMQSRYTVVSCMAVPAGVEVEIRAHTDGTGEKRILFARVRGSFTNELWVRDLWVSTPNGWRIKRRMTFQNETRTSPG